MRIGLIGAGSSVEHFGQGDARLSSLRPAVGGLGYGERVARKALGLGQLAASRMDQRLNLEGGGLCDEVVRVIRKPSTALRA